MPCPCGCSKGKQKCKCSKRCAGCGCGGPTTITTPIQLISRDDENKSMGGCCKEKRMRRRRGGDATKATDVAENASIEAQMTSLWDSHGFLTYLVLITAVKNNNASDPTEFDAYVNKLMENQDNIGWMFNRKFGKDMADLIANKLREHIDIAKQIVGLLNDAIKPISSVSSVLGLDALFVKWDNNAKEIGDKLGELDDKSISGPGFSKDKWKMHMLNHLELLKPIVLNYVNGSYTDAAALIPKYIKQIREMAVMMAKLVSGPSVKIFTILPGRSLSSVFYSQPPLKRVRPMVIYNKLPAPTYIPVVNSGYPVYPYRRFL